jgi:hypothetical protein
MVQVHGIEDDVAEISVSKLRDPSTNKTVVIEGKGAIRHSLVPEHQVRIGRISKDESTDTWFSGRMIFRP